MIKVAFELCCLCFLQNRGREGGVKKIIIYACCERPSLNVHTVDGWVQVENGLFVYKKGAAPTKAKQDRIIKGKVFRIIVFDVKSFVLKVKFVSQ